MNVRKFWTAFYWSLWASVAIVAYLADTSASSFQVRMNIVIAILLVLLSFFIALYASIEKRVPRSRLSARDRSNAAMFRHYPKSAAFQVRSRPVRYGYKFHKE